MNEKIRKGVIFGALVASILWAGNYYWHRGENVVSLNTPTNPIAVQASVAAIPSVEKTIDVAEMKNKSWGDDPFRAIVKKSAGKVVPSKPSWKLSGIVYNSNRPLAVINGKSVTVGDKLGDAQVIEIDRKSVILEHNGARFTLTISKG